MSFRYIILFPLAVWFNIQYGLYILIEGPSMHGKGRLSSRFPRLSDWIEHTAVTGTELCCAPDSWLAENDIVGMVL